MDDLKTACPVCGRQEKSTLRYSGEKPMGLPIVTIDDDGTVPAKCIQCGWEGRVFVKAELGLLKQESIACTKEHPWDKKTLPVMHVNADYVDDETELLGCPNCGYTWSLGPDV